MPVHVLESRTTLIAVSGVVHCLAASESFVGRGQTIASKISFYFVPNPVQISSVKCHLDVQRSVATTSFLTFRMQLHLVQHFATAA